LDGHRCLFVDILKKHGLCVLSTPQPKNFGQHLKGL